jgi:hypothetical protein
MPHAVADQSLLAASLSSAESAFTWNDIKPAYESARGHLLLLGAGGSGKTWILHSLAARLCRVAIDDPHAQIPVILQLADWPPRQQSQSRSEFADWVARHISEDYEIREAVSHWWLDRGDLVLLLDGFDEITASARSQCVTDIKRFLESYGTNSIIVTSRNIWDNSETEKLRLDGAVEIAPLSVDALLADGSLPWLSQLSQSDLEDWAREIFDSPLMLSLAAVVLSQPLTRELQAAAKDVRRSLVFDAYLAKVIGDPDWRDERAGYSADRFGRYLTSFAGLLATLQLTAFALRDLTSAALPVRLCRLVTVGFPLISGAGAGALASLWVPTWWAGAIGCGVALMLIPDAPVPGLNGLANRDLVVATCAVLLATGEAVAVSKIGGVRGLAVLLVALLLLGTWRDVVGNENFFMCAFGIGAGLAGTAVFSAHIVSNRLANIALAAGGIFVGGVVLGALVGTALAVTDEFGKSRRSEEYKRQFDIGEAVTGGAGIGAFVAFFVTVASGVFLARAIVVRQSPLAVIPVALGAVCQIFVWIVESELNKSVGPYRAGQLSILAPLGAILAVPVIKDWLAVPLVALVGSMLYIVCYLAREHDGISLLRRPMIHALLASQRVIPWGFRRFADSAVNRMLFRRVDERYMFWHPLLREHIYQKSLH